MESTEPRCSTKEAIIATDGILIVDQSDEFIRHVKEVLEGAAVAVRSLPAAVERVEAGEVDVVFLGPSFASEAGVGEAASQLLELDPDLIMVLVASADISNNVLRAAIRAGLRDVVEAPLGRRAVESILRQAERRQRRRVELPPDAGGNRDGKIITVMAAKGGSGKTVLATNVASLLGKWGDPARVVIVDADLQFGDVALVLQVEPKHTVVNAAKEGPQLDPAMLEKVLARSANGVRVLAAPLEPAFADEVPIETLTRIMTMLKRMFDFVVVDTAPSLDERLLAILERSDQVLFIVDMDLPSVKNAKLALETLRILNYPANKIKVILNRSNSRARLDVDEIERSLRVQIAAAVPSDGLVPASVNEGVPIIESHPKSKPAKAFEEVARLVTDVEPEAPRKRRWRS